MKLRIVAAAAVLLAGVAAAPAMAQDLSPWTGFYIGAQGGHLWGTGQGAYYPELDPVTVDGWPDMPLSGNFWGGATGAWVQSSGGFTFGLDTDLNFPLGDGIWGWGPVHTGGIAYPGDYDGNLSIDWFGSTRARVGFAIGRLLPFVSVGGAYAGYDFLVTDMDGPLAYTQPGVMFGVTAGAGVSFRLTEQLAFTTEYRFTHYLWSNAGELNGIPSDAYDTDYDVAIRANTHTILFGVSVLFR